VKRSPAFGASAVLGRGSESRRLADPEQVHPRRKPLTHTALARLAFSQCMQSVAPES
jgi:hypothetical protein